ncbi:MAG: dual specificity protein phosphatase family protein [Nitrososphaerota archaeon]
MWRRVQGLFTSSPPNFSWVSERIAASGLPSRKRHLRWLRSSGITAVLSLTENPLPKHLTDFEPIIFIHIPMRNHEKPPPEKLARAIRELDRLVKSGERVLVHCTAGLGRTGTVLAAYIIYGDGLDYLKAVEKIRIIRPGSIDDVQVESLREFEMMIRAGS